MRIALQTGAKLVPVVGFGEPDLYDIKESGPLRLQLAEWTKKWLGFTLPNPIGQGFFWGKLYEHTETSFEAKLASGKAVCLHRHTNMHCSARQICQTGLHERFLN